MEKNQITKKLKSIVKTEFSDRPGYLYAFMSGPEDSVQASFKAWKKICTECHRRKCDRVLVEEEIGTQLTPAEISELLPRLLSLDFIGIRVAFVDRYQEHFPDNLLVETAGINQGLDVKIFHEREDAVEWLLS